jgi:transposase
MQIIACDVSKGALDVSWFDEDKECWVDRSGLPNNGRGWRHMLRWARRVCGCAPGQMMLVLEATGVYHCPLADFCHAQGLRVVVVNPGRAAENARSHNRLNKSDKLDARGLQRFGRELDNPRTYLPDILEINRLRALLSRLRQLDKDLQRERNRLEKCPYIAESADQAQSIRRQIRHLEREQVRIQQLVDQLIASNDQLHRLRLRLLSITGIGPVASQSLLPLLYRQQFQSARQLAAFIGLTPVHKNSGKTLRARPRLSGRGNPYLRSRLYMPAVAAIRHDPGMADFYNRLLRRGKTPKQAIVAVMRKLVHIAYGVARNGQNYRPTLVN